MPDPKIIFESPIIEGSGDNGHCDCPDCIKANGGVPPGEPQTQNCSVELLGLAIYGNYEHGYHLPCIDVHCQDLVVHANDVLSDEVRNSKTWRLLVMRLGTCHRTPKANEIYSRLTEYALRRYAEQAPALKPFLEDYLRYRRGEVDFPETMRKLRQMTKTRRLSRKKDKQQKQELYKLGFGILLGGGLESLLEKCESDEEVVDFVDDILTQWHKIAVDEGCAIPDDTLIDDEYEEFIKELDEILPELMAESDKELDDAQY